MQYQTAIPETGFVRLPQVLSVFPVSRSTWWAGVKSGKYPRPVKLGENTTAWRAEDIRQLIESHNRVRQPNPPHVAQAA